MLAFFTLCTGMTCENPVGPRPRRGKTRGAAGTDHSGGYVIGAGDPMPFRRPRPLVGQRHRTNALACL
ncbi:hypothetical protein GCM10027199_42690 [Amycolatopsis magusensis]